MLDWGRFERDLRTLQRQGIAVESLDNKPELFPDSLQIWEAWQYLHLRRQSTGFGVSAIPLTEIQAWCDLCGLSSIEDKLEMMELITAMDASWLEWARSKDTDADSGSSN